MDRLFIDPDPIGFGFMGLMGPDPKSSAFIGVDGSGSVQICIQSMELINADPHSEYRSEFGFEFGFEFSIQTFAYLFSHNNNNKIITVSDGQK